MIKIIAIQMIALSFIGCGVRGDPVAPAIPAEIGRGKPTYKRAMKKLKINQNAQDAEAEQDEEESQDADE